MNPELTINNTPLDFELTELLGDRPCDFLVLCFNGVQLENYGTPYDTAANRSRYEQLIARLNDRTKKSLWPEVFKNWQVQICQQFALPPETTAKDFRPVVSYQISRVCPGYSTHLHVAVRLFETLADRIVIWQVATGERGFTRVEVVTKAGTFCSYSKPASLAIAQAVRDMLKAAV